MIVSSRSYLTAGVGSWACALGGDGALAAGRAFFGLGCVGVFGVVWVGFVRNKAGGAGVAYGTLTRRTGWRVAVRAWRRRGLAGQAAPVSPFTEDRRSTPGHLTSVCSFLPGRLPNTPAPGIAYGATDSRPFPFTPGSVFLSLWWLAIWSS